jgi:hypothetical protein
MRVFDGNFSRSRFLVLVGDLRDRWLLGDGLAMKLKKSVGDSGRRFRHQISYYALFGVRSLFFEVLVYCGQIS